MDCRVLCFLLRKRRGAKKDSKLAKNSYHKHVAKSCHKIRQVMSHMYPIVGGLDWEQVFRIFSSITFGIQHDFLNR